MSKLAMKKVFICGLKKDGKKILDLLQRAGVVEVKEQKIDNENIAPSDVVNDKAKFERYVKLCDDTLDIMNKYQADTSSGLLDSLAEAKKLDLNSYSSKVVSVKPTMDVCDQVNNHSKEISEYSAQIPKLENKIAQLKVWEQVNIPLNFEGTQSTKAFIGSLKNEISKEDVHKMILENVSEECAKYVDINILSTTKEMTCIMVVTINQYKDEVENALKKCDFARSPLTSTIPSVEIKNINDDILETKDNIQATEEKIKHLTRYREDVKFARDYYAMRVDKYDTISKIPTTRNAYFISGYVLSKYANQLEDKINKEVNAYVEIVDPDPNDDVPVALQNGFLADPMETVVESYSLPNSTEFDPSIVLAVFYYILFGLMLSDAGYGLLLFLGTFILLRTVKNMKPGIKKMLKLFCFGGICTIFWGILFGSFFGDSIDVIAHNYLGVPEDQAVLVPFLDKLHLYWFDPVIEPMRLLMFAFLLGIIHLLTGLCLKGYILLKQNLVKDFIFDVIFWLLFVVGGIFAVLGTDMLASMIGEGFSFPKTLSQAGMVAMCIGAVGVVFTGGRESTNWFKRLLKGAYAAYGITGWLSDILSYSRLLALGLATGIIAQVFNKMGSMIKVPFLGLIIFIIVFIIGHLLNLGINVLGAYVHTNRLQFVEFFGKFYSGGGKKFEPFTENTKYFIIKEDK